jgi:hypothetical protein
VRDAAEAVAAVSARFAVTRTGSVSETARYLAALQRREQTRADARRAAGCAEVEAADAPPPAAAATAAAPAPTPAFATTASSTAASSTAARDEDDEDAQMHEQANDEASAGGAAPAPTRPRGPRRPVKPPKPKQPDGHGSKAWPREGTCGATPLDPTDLQPPPLLDPPTRPRDLAAICPGAARRCSLRCTAPPWRSKSRRSA